MLVDPRMGTAAKSKALAAGSFPLGSTCSKGLLFCLQPGAASCPWFPGLWEPPAEGNP